MKIEIPGGIIFHDVTPEEARLIVELYGPAARSAHEAKTEGTLRPNASPEPDEAKGRKGHSSHPRARYVPNAVKVPSASKQEAMLKLYRGLKSVRHKQAIRFLASKGPEGARAEDLKRATGMPEEMRISGFTASVTRSAPAYGLDGDEVLIVENLGAVGNVRIYTYRLAPEMLEVMRSQGLTDPGKPLRVAPSAVAG